MSRTIRSIALLVSLSCLAGSSVFAQEEKSFPTIGLGGNIGFQKLNSGSGLMEIGADMPIYFTEHFAVGPWVQVGFSQKTVNLIATANARWKFDFLERTHFAKVEPFVQGGLGVAYTKVNGSGAADFAMNMGFGAEVPVSDHFYVGSDVMFTPILTRSQGANWAFSWQFATLRYRF